MDPLPIPTVPLHNPLSAEDEAVLDNIRTVLPVISDVIARAKDCGIDMTAHSERHANHENAVRKLKERFFPTTLRPPQSMTE